MNAQKMKKQNRNYEKKNNRRCKDAGGANVIVAADITFFSSRRQHWHVYTCRSKLQPLLFSFPIGGVA